MDDDDALLGTSGVDSLHHQEALAVTGHVVRPSVLGNSRVDDHIERIEPEELLRKAEIE
ncbi:MAG TPA: hypothetical protein VLK65_17820 [Vicinamibacteria bacterium]|nr:hypothetical protein [Vicinamibacteria bacterium]